MAVTHNNCVPVPVDAEFTSWNINPLLIEKKITKKTKAIIVVHFLGNPADMATINKIAKRFNIHEHSVRKWAIRYNIPFPPVGYWAKVYAGYDDEALKMKKDKLKEFNLI